MVIENKITMFFVNLLILLINIILNSSSFKVVFIWSIQKATNYKVLKGQDLNNYPSQVVKASDADLVKGNQNMIKE